MMRCALRTKFWDLKDCTLWLILAIMVLVFLSRFAFLMIYREGDFNLSGKMTSWSRIAYNLANGKGYVYDSDLPTARRGPVPIFFMASLFFIFGPEAFPIPLVVSQWFWDAASAVLIYFIARELFGMRRVAFLAMILFALHPIIIENSVRVNVEPLATFLLLAFVLTFLRAIRNPDWVHFIWPGLFLGLSILSLGVLQFFPVVAAGLIIFLLRAEGWRRIFVAITVFCLSVVVVLLPWIFRNYLALGAFVPASTLGGHNLLRNHQTLGEPDYLRFRTAQEDKIVTENLFVTKGIDLSDFSEVEQDKLFRETAVDFITTYPDRYIILSLIRFPRLWFQQGLSLAPDRLGYVAVLVNGALMLLTVMAVLYFRDNWTKPALLLLMLLAYATVLYMAIAAELRYSIPFTPLLVILGAYAIVNISTWLLSGFKHRLRPQFEKS